MLKLVVFHYFFVEDYDVDPECFLDYPGSLDLEEH